MENIRFGNGEDGQIPFKEEKEKKKRGRPRKSEQVIRIVKKKKELHSQTTEDDVWKLKETSGANPEKQLLMKGHEKQKQTEGEGVAHVANIKQGVGEYVDGVIDGAFDAGYLVTIKIGSDTDRLYHGVVFGPELYTPINQQNDVVPQLKMITYASQGTSGYGYGLA